MTRERLIEAINYFGDEGAEERVREAASKGQLKRHMCKSCVLAKAWNTRVGAFNCPDKMYPQEHPFRDVVVWFDSIKGHPNKEVLRILNETG